MKAPNVAANTRAAIATTQVLAWRTPMLALLMVDPTPRRRREATRMVTEKHKAVVLGMLNAQAELIRGCWLWWSRPHALMMTPIGLTESFLAPSYRTVAANARRLRKRKTR